MSRPSSLRLTIVGIGVTVLLGAQPPNVFDAASIRVNRSGERGFSIAGIAGGRYQAKNIPAKILVAQAFGVRESQIANAPGWTEGERYDIIAKSSLGPGGSDQIKPRLQAMLADRFQLLFHREAREIPGYALVVAKGGPKIKPNHGADTPDLKSNSNRAGATISGTRVPISELVKHLEGELDTPVSDNTGLTGAWDFQLQWTHETNPGDTSPPFLTQIQEQLGLKYPPIFTALQEQLGLKLNSTKKARVEVIVIDRIARASEN
jgi:uncharacterized protein (TIGR03435 family)